MSEGHPNAPSYPLGMLLDETEMAVDRINNNLVTRTLLIESMFSALPNQAIRPQDTKKARRRYSELITKLAGE